MKNKYIHPEIAISAFEQENVLTISGTTTNISANDAAETGLLGSDFYADNAQKVLAILEF